jgi:hypothetical protein
MALSLHDLDKMSRHRKAHTATWLLLISLLVVTAIYWPGLSGGWLFDDYPNIVDNSGTQPHEVSVAALASAALSSPASDFKRPLASLSFAANYLASGLDPFYWKLANLFIHLLNGLLVFVLARRLLIGTKATPAAVSAEPQPTLSPQVDTIAALMAAGWMLLPINLTAVLYVVQREESLANLFVLIGLIGYMAGRQQMLRVRNWSSFSLCAASVTLPAAVGLLAKETAVMLPLYALLIEWIVFSFRCSPTAANRRDGRIIVLFVSVLLLPMAAGLVWQLPKVLNPATWVTHDFTLGQRLLSEARVVCDYVVWTLFPTPRALSFYHDDFRVSTGLLSPWTTLASLLGVATLIAAVFLLRHRKPLTALGIALFLGCQLLTSTILPLELVYEHRNYFASFGLLLIVMPWLTTTSSSSLLLPRHVLLGGLLAWWCSLTAITAYAWGDPLRLAQELAARAPDSPRAQYELGRTYIIYSHYDPASPYTQLAYAPLEKAASFPESSILPQQALIFMNSRMGRPLKIEWWNSMIAKLKSRPTGVQDDSSLAALTQSARDHACPLPDDRMVLAFETALDHPSPSARLQATYGDYAWNVLNDHALGLRMIEGAVKADPGEPAYQITMIRMLAAQGLKQNAIRALDKLRLLDIGGRLDSQLGELGNLLGQH